MEGCIKFMWDCLLCCKLGSQVHVKGLLMLYTELGKRIQIGSVLFIDDTHMFITALYTFFHSHKIEANVKNAKKSTYAILL